MVRSILLFMAGWLLIAPAHAQTVNDDGRASVEVLQPSTVSKQSDLDFGSLIVTGAGTVTVNAGTNAITTTGGVTRLGTDGTRADFLGERSGISFIYLEVDSTVTLTEMTGSGGADMTADLTLAATNVIWGFQRSPGYVLLVVGPEQHYYVGGTLTILDGQLPGIYEGTFSITVDNP